MTKVEYSRKHRAKNIEKYRRSSRLWRLNNKEKYTNTYLRYKRERKNLLKKLKNVPCADCRIIYPSICMDFDHKKGSIKLGEIGKMIYASSKERLMNEIAKCEVVCANCHRIRTFEKYETNLS